MERYGEATGLADLNVKEGSKIMKTQRIFANIGLYSLGIILSCGPSQVYGLIKGVIDLVKYAQIRSKISKLEAQGKLSSHRFTELSNTLKRKQTSIKADFIAMIPLVGALFSWRVLAPKEVHKTLDATKGIPFATAHLLGDFHYLLRQILYPINTPTSRSNEEISAIAHHFEWLKNISQDVHTFRRIEIPVKIREGTLDAFEMLHPPGVERPTVVPFHGNAMKGLDMHELGLMYYRWGFNVLMPTMGGYPGSSDCKTTEASSIQDTEAVKAYLIEKQVKHVGYHGLSIGGTLAFQAAAVSSAATEQIKALFVVADQTFTSAQDVFSNVVKNFNLKLGAVAKGVALAAVPPGDKTPIAENEWLQTDGLDNLSKVKKLKEKGIRLIAIEATQDLLMKNLKKPNPLKPDFAERLLSAYYDHPAGQRFHLLQLNGRHCSFISTANERYKLKAALTEFIPNAG